MCFSEALHERAVGSLIGSQRRVASSHQQVVSFAWWHVKGLGKIEHHLTARDTAAAFDKTDMLLRNTSIKRQIQLRLAANIPPLAEKYAGGIGGCFAFASGRFHCRSFVCLSRCAPWISTLRARVAPRIRGTRTISALPADRRERINRKKPVPLRQPSDAPWCCPSQPCKKMGHRGMQRWTRPVVWRHIHDAAEHFQETAIPVFGNVMQRGEAGVDEGL